ncbi:MAG TPA: zf-HC2 domain-containing protein [Vicinamibacteria bacterium]|nr:zf-HC2 domain-containing protein [Vicinamibacteria bacterium]
MNCPDVEERLSAYVDGDLGEAEFQDLELHLATCVACQSEERELRALLIEAPGLAQEVSPPRDLWPGIAARIRTQRRPRVFTLGSTLAALAAGLALLAILTGRGPFLPVAPNAQSHAAAAGEAARLAELERQYDRVTAELLAVLNARRDSLPPETMAAVEQDLRSIDDALGRVRVALASDPTDPGLNHLLASTHQKKVNALRHVVRLAAQL